MITLLLAFLLAGTACDKTDSNKATNDSAATVEEVVLTATAETTVAATTIKATEPKPEHSTESVTDSQTESQTEVVADDQPSVDEQEIEYANEGHVGYELPDSEVDLIAKATYLESGNCGEYCQWLTASTVLNLAESRGGIASVVYDYNTFNVAEMIDSCSPSDLSYSVAQRVVSGDRDFNVMAFRADYYHSFGTPYASVDNVYFSTY